MTNIASWQRLERVINWANMTINYFGHHIGLPRSEPLYQIRAGLHGISKGLARRIVEHFPEISIGWLLTGEGEMLLNAPPCKNIPFYEGEISAGVKRLMSSEPLCSIAIPFIDDSDFAFRISDEAMSPEIMVGTIVFLKKTDLNAIIPGGLYVIVCANYVILRRIRVNEDETEPTYRLEATNPSYDTITIGAEQIVEIYRVMGNLKLY